MGVTEGTGDEGILYEMHKETQDNLGKHEGFEGKAREHWHPFDRKSGTGRGKELPKGGHGKANWGDMGDELKSLQGGQVMEIPEVPLAHKVEAVKDEGVFEDYDKFEELEETGKVAAPNQE